MKSLARILLFACVALVLYVGGGPVAAKEGRVALLVGNSAYRSAPSLKAPLNDTRDMAGALTELGFDVIRVENAGKQQLERALAQFSQKLGEGSVGLFFFSGYGIQLNGRNYLIPVDAELGRESSLLLEALDASIVLELMNMAHTRLNLVILDASRSHPFERRFRTNTHGLAPVDQAPRDTFVAFSDEPGKVVSDGDRANGLYAAELVRAIRQPDQTVEQVFKKVRIAVSAATSNEQTPWEMSSLTSDFYFKR